jgi:hypothetical protein
VIRRPWRRRSHEPQIGNAHRDFLDLTPVSEDAAENTRNNWSALQPGQEIPLIWERNRS